MARRAGKAASRKARQRNAPRQPRRPAVAAPPRPEVEEAPAAVAEVTDADAPARVAAPRRSPSSPARETIGSQLTDRERAGYHYVEADLRDIGILTVAMTALLLIAWFVFSALGLAG